MLKLVPNPTFKSKVSFELPGEGAGSADLMIEFKHMGRKALNEWVEKFQTKEGEDAPQLSDEDAVADIVVGWEGVDAEFNKKNLATLVDMYPAFSRATINVYIPALLDGSRKNSK